MKRRSKTYSMSSDEQDRFMEKALSWASMHSHFSYFNHNDIPYPFGPFPRLLAVGCHLKVPFLGKDDFSILKSFQEIHQEWLIGYFAYDLKNQLENLHSEHRDTINAPEIYFYVPEHLFHCQDGAIKIESYTPTDEVYETIYRYSAQQIQAYSPISIHQTIQKDEYLQKVQRLKEHIEEGDIYEINLCMEFLAEQSEIHPLHTYYQLTEASPTPFATLQRIDDIYLMCASPERFLKKEGQKLISQPIKGTIRRGKDKKEDEILKRQLRTDEKELAENMMIVDLVRNDLARSSKAGTVKVDELFGIYTFETLHQMISTVSSELKEEVHFIDAIKAAFPMGSMTGAPKIKVMELIETYEESRRGIYSGATGFITPEGDFDFNVIIRSLLYDKKRKNLSFQVGSAITYDSIPSKEYEECMLKADGLLKALGHTSYCP